jgi:hypothetical protein
MAVAVRARAVCPLGRVRANLDAAALVEMVLVGNAARLEGDWVFRVDRDRRDTHEKGLLRDRYVNYVALSGLLCQRYGVQITCM